MRSISRTTDYKKTMIFSIGCDSLKMQIWAGLFLLLLYITTGVLFSQPGGLTSE